MSYFKCVSTIAVCLTVAFAARANGPVHENVSPGPEEPNVESPNSPRSGNQAILPINYSLPGESSPNLSDAVRDSVHDFLKEHPDCMDQKYRYCDVYLPAASSNGDDVECADGYTFISNENLGVFIDRRSSPPKPKGMLQPGQPALEDLLRAHRSKAIMLGVCRRI